MPFMRNLPIALCLASLVGAQAPTGLPELTIKPLPTQGKLAAFRPDFTKHVLIFGVSVVATADTTDRKVLHAAAVLAQYLDNDEDGEPDNPRVTANLRSRGAFLAMTARERDFRKLRIDWEELEEAGFELGQDLYGEETLPDGPPHRNRRGRFDASIEEVLHLVSHGYEEVYPQAFGFRSGSALAKAMDLARGGKFNRLPRRYPEQAWYHYRDRTCDYECQCAEYFYWALTSMLGGQNYLGRAEEIAEEWELPTREDVEQRDPAAFELLTDPSYRLPKALPDGKYGLERQRTKAGDKKPLFSPDLSLLQPRSREDHRRLGGRAPYFAHYRKKDRELVFLAARHEPRTGSSTHKLIEAVMKGFAPDYLIVEGIETKAGPSPSRPLRDARRRRTRGDCPEPLFAIALAADRDTPFIGGEPPPSSTAAALRKIGNDEDALGFIVVRNLGQVRREEGLDALDARVERSLPRMKQRFGLKTDMDLDGFKAWYLERTGKPFAAEHLRGDQTAPLAGPRASFLQRMAIEVMLSRERHLVALEAKLLSKHHRVMVVYGSGHLIYERAILQAMLDAPIHEASKW